MERARTDANCAHNAFSKLVMRNAEFLFYHCRSCGMILRRST